MVVLAGNHTPIIRKGKKLDTKWIMIENDTENSSVQLEGYNRIEAKILYSKGIKSDQQAREFLDSGASTLPSGDSILGIKQAVHRIWQARENEERVVVYGDYDADGITATVIIIKGLARMGIQATHYVPDRDSEGYGLNIDAIKKLIKQGNKLLITVDCGIRAIEQIAFARTEGLDVIVCDHHIPGSEIPQDVIVVDPKQEADRSEFKDYCAAGLAYILIKTLNEKYGESACTDLLDIAAIGTVADMVPLLGPNRTIAAQGISQLQHTSNTGLQALMEVSGGNKYRTDARMIAFGLAPRLNAAGRIESADISIKLLLEENPAAARELAEELDRINRRRRELTDTSISKARSLVDDDGLPTIIFVSDPEFDEGIVGLVASRLKDEYYRPVIVGAISENTTRASARSIPAFDITAALETQSEALIRYGGHRAAAGFTVANDRVDEIIRALTKRGDLLLSEDDLLPELHITLQVTLNELNMDLLGFLDKLEPYGMQNQKPLFCALDVDVVSVKAVGAGKNHLKMTLIQNGAICDAIAFRKGKYLAEITKEKRINIAFNYERDEYYGIVKPQLNIQDIKTGSINQKNDSAGVPR